MSDELEIRIEGVEEEEEEELQIISAGIEIPEVVHNILIFCDLITIGRVMLVSKRFHLVSTDNRLWKHILRNIFSYQDSLDFDFRHLRTVDREQGIFENFQTLANREIQITNRQERADRENVRLLRNQRILRESGPFLKFLAIFCPVLASPLSYLFLRDSGKQGTAFIVENMQDPFALLTNLSYLVIFPKDPQIADCGCTCLFSCIFQFFCCCWVSSLLSYFSVLRLESRLSENERTFYWNDVWRWIVTICSPSQLFCFPMFLFCGGLFLLLSLMFMNDSRFREYGGILFLLLISPCLLYVFGCLWVFGGIQSEE